MQTSFAESEDDPVRRPLVVAGPHVGGGDQPDRLLDGLAHQWRAVPDGFRQERMGHSQIMTTQKYLHTLPDADDKALAAFEAVRHRG